MGPDYQHAFTHFAGGSGVLRGYYTDAEMASFGGIVGGYATDPSFSGIRGAARRGDAAGAMLQTGYAAASRGDFNTIANLPYGDATRKMFADMGWQHVDTIQQAQLTGAGIQQAGARFGEMGATGAGYAGLQRQLDTMIDLQRTLITVLQAQRAQAANGGNTVAVAQMDAAIASAQGTIAQQRGQRAGVEYSQRQTAIGAASSFASTELNRVTMRGGTAMQMVPAYAGLVNAARQQAQVLREQAANDPRLNDAQRAQLRAQAAQAEQEAEIGIPRQLSQTQYQQDVGFAQFTGAEAGFAGTRAQLFGTPAESRQASLQQAGAIGQQIRAMQDLLARGLVPLPEIAQHLAAIRQLQGQQLEVTTNAYREEASQNLQIAQGRMGIASTQMQTGFMRGVGGTAAEDLSLGYLATAGGGVARAQQQVDLLVRQGESENSGRMVAARQALASAQQGQVGAEIGLANAPALDVTGQRELSRARYQTQVLSMLPGSYGSIRGALRTTVRDLEKEGQAKKDQYAEVVKQYGGEEHVPEYVKHRFKSSSNTLGCSKRKRRSNSAMVGNLGSCRKRSARPATSATSPTSSRCVTRSAKAFTTRTWAAVARTCPSSCRKVC